MALYICPRCKQKDCTWSMGEDETGREVTDWHCSCGFRGYENESYESDGRYRFEPISRGCTNCGSTRDIKLHNDGKEYLWCNRCHLLTEQPTD